MLENIIKRFGGIEKQIPTPNYSKATLLDPRFKKVAFGVEENANDTEKCIISEVADLLHISNAGKDTIYL